MTQIKSITPIIPASDPEIIEYLRALLRKACKEKIEWADFRGMIQNNGKQEYLDFYWPPLD